MLENLLFFVNQLKSFFPVDGCQRLHTHRSDFVSLPDLNCCPLYFFDVKLAPGISDSFLSLKLLFTSSS